MTTSRERWEDRYRRIGWMWETQSESGVTIHPMKAAVHAVENLGCDVAKARQLLERAASQYEEDALDALLMTSARINKELNAAVESVQQDAPSTWSAYRRDVTLPLPSQAAPVDHAVYLDRVRGAWLGKLIGTALGDPVEGWTRKAIAAEHGWVDRYLVPPKTENDDTAYPILVLHALDEYGMDFTSEQLALEWVAHLPFGFTAEQTALDNVKAGIMPPDARWRGNPCGAWIGAQMRGEIHGLLAPLRPEAAAELAFRDAVISHYREGLDGEIYAAVLISEAFADLPMEERLRRALAYVPADSPLVATVEKTIDWCRQYGEWIAVAERIEEEMGRYHWIHTLPNLACVICGLLLGEGDFERTVLTTLACGQDTDCSAGQAGALLGAILGHEGLPEKWTAPIGNTLDTYVIGFEKIDLQTLVEWTVGWGERLSAHRPSAEGGDAS